MTKITGPRDGDIVSALFNSKTKSKSYFSSLRDTKDLVLLSIVGNEFCSGKYLGAIVDQAVDTHQRKENTPAPKGFTTFLIADEIYWHNLKEMECTELEEQRLKQKALELGKDYFEKNLGYFLKPLGLTVDEFRAKHADASMDEQILIINNLALRLGKNFEIVRWKDWVARDKSEKLKEIQPLYNSVSGLKNGIDKSVKQYVQRALKKGDEAALLEHRSRDYLTEESPAVMWLSAALGYNFIIYPGESLPSFDATRDYFVLKNHAPYVFEGQSIEDNCTHDKNALHFETPARTANWLEVSFKMSYSAALKTKPQNSSQGFFKQSAPELTGGADSSIDRFRLFPTTKSGAGSAEGTSTTNKSLNALLYGLGMASNKVQGRDAASDLVLRLSPNQDLTKVAQGVSEAILKSDLPINTKYQLLFNLIAAFSDSKVHIEPSTTATSLLSSSMEESPPSCMVQH
ncbi:hypothetical protein [Legionella waltersii]|uniref:Uncharacterized protein n=1 Tax=Legionella waltersii TaxID=66969 RepID=A0A0W1AD68_9GAMM|nr:hypothetical protein [Legionella waltersii]KTD79302.1 hypothetical protein Lwal_1374 [Legionella waltersii]SNV12970.1 Uncharacterised protein [Legionella waltersii]